MQAQSQNVNFAHDISNDLLGVISGMFSENTHSPQTDEWFCSHCHWGFYCSAASGETLFSFRRATGTAPRIAKLSACTSVCGPRSFCQVLWKLQPLYNAAMSKRSTVIELHLNLKKKKKKKKKTLCVFVDWAVISFMPRGLHLSAVSERSVPSAAVLNWDMSRKMALLLLCFFYTN